MECEKYLDRIDRLKSALRERTLAYDSLQLRHMDLTTANENLKLRLARKSRPNTAGSRRSKRSKSPRNSRPVSASVVAGLAKGQSNQQQLDDAEGKARPRPKSAGSLSSSSRSIGSLRPSSAGSLRPSSAGSMSSGTSSTSSKKVAFAGPAIDDGKNIRPGSGHSVLSPVKEIREEEDSREEDERKETDKSSDGEETKNKDGDSSSEGSSSNENSNEDSDEDSGGEEERKKRVVMWIKIKLNMTRNKKIVKTFSIQKKRRQLISKKKWKICARTQQMHYRAPLMILMSNKFLRHDQ